jgi:adenosylcobinamide kinase/adenosylcobinamide-phosphate guanylyltransferase
VGLITLVTGGARSGKSAQAEALAAAAGPPVVYLATMEPRDAELAARIAQHRARRPAAWRTVEEPLDAAAALSRIDSAATVLLDCLSLWVSNLFFAAGLPDEAAPPVAWDALIDRCLGAVDALLAAQTGRAGALIAVTNEVGLGIVPGDRLSRYYRDALGLANQRVARAAGRVILMVSGRALELPAS